MLKTRVPPPLYALLAGLVILGLHRYLPGPVIVRGPVGHWAWVIAVAAGFLTLWSVVVFRSAGTTVNPLTPSKASRLVARGPYQISRNPMYLGFVVVLLAWASYLGSLSGFFVLPLFIVVVTYQQILPEERALEAKFGDDYVHYKQRVRRWVGRAAPRGRRP